MRDLNENELAPCIVSWAKYALKIKTIKPKNDKKCSKKYWIKSIDCLLVNYPENKIYRINAIDNFNYVKKI